MDVLMVNLIEGLTSIVASLLVAVIGILPYALLLYGAYKIFRIGVSIFLFIMGEYAPSNHSWIWKERFDKWDW